MRPIHEHEIGHERAVQSKFRGHRQRVVLGVFAFIGPVVAALLLLSEQGLRAADPGFLVVVGAGYWFGLATFIMLGGET